MFIMFELLLLGTRETYFTFPTFFLHLEKFAKSVGVDCIPTAAAAAKKGAAASFAGVVGV